MSEMTKVFTYDPSDSDPWNAYFAAESWVMSQGYSVGRMQAGAPTAIFKGDCDVSKWRNLSRAEQEACDGTIKSRGGRRFREEDAIVSLFR